MAFHTQFLLIFLCSTLMCHSFVTSQEIEPDDESSEFPPDNDDADPDETIETPVDSAVEVLSKDNFTDFIGSNDIVLAEFYAPWCGHCQQLAPVYESAAKTLRDNVPPVRLTKIDATVEKDLAQQYDVNGYPTLKWFRKGETFEYDGPRSHEGTYGRKALTLTEPEYVFVARMQDKMFNSIYVGIVSYMKERASPDWKPPPEAVVTLTSENFTSTVTESALMLVEFYAPWCGHCKRLAPEYEKAAQMLKTHEPPIMLAKVDATVETSLASTYGITGYPTLKVFRNGKAFDYKGDKSQHGIQSYMVQQTGPASKEKSDLKELQQVFSESDVTIVGFFTDSADPLYSVYVDAANSEREDYKWHHTFDAAAATKYDVKPSSIVVFQPARFHTKYEPKRHTITDSKSTPEEIMEFIRRAEVPLVGEYNFHTKGKKYQKPRPLCLLFYTVDWTFDHRDATQFWRKKIAKQANDYKQITFAVADEETMADEMKKFGLDDSPEEVNLGCWDKTERAFAMEPMDEWDDDSVVEFLDNFVAGKVKPHIKSQPVPKKKTGPVTVVVGHTFEQIVYDKTKDVLIELYAPWCTHCKALEPIYKDLAKKYKSHKNLVIAKMDATENDSPPSYEISGFPSIYFAAANSDKNKPVKYSGERTLDAFSEFIESHTSASAAKSKDEL